MRVQLKQEKWPVDNRPGWHVDAWLTAEPFFVNPRAQLTHRVAAVNTMYQDGEISHYCVRYLCGNGAHFEDPVACLVAVPPEDRLVCTMCEFKAEQAGLKSSDELAGKHVHKGKLVPVQTCCQNHKGRN